MAARLDEGTQFFDETTGALLVNASIYIGTVLLDPKLNLISIFSDRALSSALANPQLTGSDGRSVNKIWIPGQYSIVVENSSGTQKFQDLDAGETASAEILNLSSVLGINAITAEGSPTITSLTDQALYILQITNLNTTDAVTLNIDTIGAKAIKRNFDQDVGKGKFKVGQTVIVAYNLANDNFEWINENARVIFQTKGADIASAATVDLSLATGNNLTITGSTGPITSFGTVLAGVVFDLTFSGTPTITHNATSLILPGAGDINIAAGDVLKLQSLGSGNFKALNFQGSSAGFPTGIVIPTIGLTAPAGWVLGKGGTIGNASSSGTTRANADTEALFLLLWNSMADAQAAVSGGRGGSAAADFAADKNIVIPDLQGKAAVGTGGTAPATHGDNGGVETQTLTTANLAVHAHTIGTDSPSGVNAASASKGTSAASASFASGNAGSGTAHNNMSPFVALNYIIKL